MDLSWMAWTPHTAGFFVFIAVLLVLMGIWEWKHPGGSPRKGILGVVTTRGDRLFVSLLLSAYVHLAWLGLTAWPLWIATVLSLGVAVFVFRRV